eukprot:11762556-Heterocapsa_arctica.AAC.1
MVKQLVPFQQFDAPNFCVPALSDEFVLELAKLDQVLEVSQIADKSTRAKQWSNWAKTALQ